MPIGYVSGGHDYPLTMTADDHCTVSQVHIPRQLPPVAVTRPDLSTLDPVSLSQSTRDTHILSPKCLTITE